MSVRCVCGVGGGRSVGCVYISVCMCMWCGMCGVCVCMCVRVRWVVERTPNSKVGNHSSIWKVDRKGGNVDQLTNK